MQPSDFSNQQPYPAAHSVQQPQATCTWKSHTVGFGLFSQAVLNSSSRLYCVFVKTLIEFVPAIVMYVIPEYST